MSDVDLDDDETGPELGNGPLYNPQDRVRPVGDDGRTDIARPCELLETLDHYHQGDIVEGIMHQGGPLTLGGDTEFHAERCRTLSLSRFRQDYNDQNKASAMQHFNQRTRIVLDDGEVLDPLDPTLVWLANTHFLDFLLIVPKDPGLSAIIPRDITNHNYAFDFSLTQPHKVWSAKYGKLGFDPLRRMLFVGKVGGQQAWLAMVPKSFWNPELVLPTKYTHDEHNLSKTVMPRGRYRRVVLMMAAMCAQARIQAITCTRRHPVNIDSTDRYIWSATTNIVYVTFLLANHFFLVITCWKGSFEKGGAST